MSWLHSETEITFICDSCPDDKIEGTTLFVNIALERARVAKPPMSDLGPCWEYARGLGWVSFKRTGRDWTYHCPTCAEKAAAEHAEWNRQERERERIKERNSRYFE